MNPSRQSSTESNLNNGNSTSIFSNENVRNISQTMVSDDEDDEDLVCLIFLAYAKDAFFRRFNRTQCLLFQV